MSPKKIFLGAGFFGVAGTAALVGTTSSTIFPKKCWYNQNGKFWEEIEQIISRNKDNKDKVDEEKIEELKELIKKHCYTDFESFDKEFDKKFHNKYSGSLFFIEVNQKMTNIKNKLEGTEVF